MKSDKKCGMLEENLFRNLVREGNMQINYSHFDPLSAFLHVLLVM